MKALIEKHGKRRVARAVFCALAMLLIIEGVIIYQAYTTIRFGDDVFRLGRISDAGLEMTDQAGGVLTAAFRPLEQVPRVTDFAFHCTVAYKGAKIYSSMDLAEDGNIYVFSDGFELEISGGFSIINGEPDFGVPLTLLQKREMELIDTVCAYFFNLKSAGVFVIAALAGLLLVLLGVYSFFYPEKVWRWDHRFSVAGGEPTEFYLGMAKFRGVFLVIIAFSLLIIAWLA